MRAAGVPIFSVPIWLLVSSTFVFAAEPTAIHQDAHGVTTTYVVPPSKLLNLDSPNRVPNQYTVVFKKDSDLLMLSASDVAGLKIAPGLLPLSQESTNTLVKAMIGWYQALDGANSTVLHVWWQFGVHGFEVKDLPDSDIADLAQDPRIEFIEADVYATTSTTIQYGAPWHLDRLDQLSGTDGLYHYDALGFSSFIYVIDSGIQADHSEFSALGEIEVFSCLTSECTLVGQSDQFDCWGHGTAVASVIGGATFGVAKAALMTALGVTDCVKGSATPGAIITAIQKTESDAALYTNFSFIINMSLNFPIVVPSVDVEINNAINQGITVIVSAGNSNIDACNSTPTDNDDARAIRVGATDATDTRWSLSNYGSCVDIFAPGANMYAAFNEGPFAAKAGFSCPGGIFPSLSANCLLSGTSLAAPIVTGIAALYESNATNTSPNNVKTALLLNTLAVVNNAGAGSPNRLADVGVPGNNIGGTLPIGITPFVVNLPSLLLLL